MGVTGDSKKYIYISDLDLYKDQNHYCTGCPKSALKEFVCETFALEG